MKTLLLCPVVILALHTEAFSQELYSSNVPSSRYNPGAGSAGTPKIIFDDINIPSSKVIGSTTIDIKKVKVGIRRIPNAPATSVSLYYTLADDTSTTSNSNISIPPVFLGTVNLPVNGQEIVTSVVTLGDSVAPLFTIPTNIGTKNTGYQTFFLGVSLNNPSTDNGIRLATGPGYNLDTVWVYDVDTSAKRYAANFSSSPVATFNVEVFGASTSLLPVKLSAFTGEQKEYLNILKWTTENELGSKGFEMQRSTDGTTFTDIGFVTSKTDNGSNTSKNNYEFVDAKPSAEGNYYRLKQIDKDGKFTISTTVLIKGFKTTAVFLSQVYPNPAKADLNLIVKAPVNSIGNIIVTDLAGHLVMKRATQLLPGNNNLSLNLTKLTAGSYTIKVICANGLETAATKFIKQ